MLVRLTLLSILVLFAAGAASAQTSEPSSPVVVVVGHGETSRPADYASLTYTLRGEGTTSVEALAALAATRARVEQALRALAGAGTVKIETGSLSVTGARSNDCQLGYAGSAPVLSQGQCAVTGYVAMIDEIVTLQPPELVGNAISLASELGAADPKFDSSTIRDLEGLKKIAIQSAMVDARARAEVAATAAGAKLGPIVRIADPEVRGQEFADRLPPAQSPPAGVAPPPVRPKVSLEFGPPPVDASADLTVIFALTH